MDTLPTYTVTGSVIKIYTHKRFWRTLALIAQYKTVHSFGVGPFFKGQTDKGTYCRWWDCIQTQSKCLHFFHHFLSFVCLFTACTILYRPIFFCLKCFACFLFCFDLFSEHWQSSLFQICFLCFKYCVFPVFKLQRNNLNQSRLGYTGCLWINHYSASYKELYQFCFAESSCHSHHN